MCSINPGDAGDRLRLGVTGGVQSCSASSKTHGKSSSSEIMEELDRYSSSQLKLEESDERRGQDGYAHEGDCGLEREDDGISIGNVE
jgi:hypothetical protein